MQGVHLYFGQAVIVQGARLEPNSRLEGVCEALPNARCPSMRNDVRGVERGTMRAVSYQKFAATLASKLLRSTPLMEYRLFLALTL